MIFKDYYKILELDSSRVTIDEIKSAYRVAAKKYHPDVNVGDSLAEERIKDINEAYRVLSTPAQKRKYDRTWNSSVGKLKKSSDKMEKSSIIGMFLGNIENKQEVKQKKDPIEESLEDSFFGKEKTIVLKNNNGKPKTLSIKLPEGIRDGEKIRLIGQGKHGKNGGKNGDLLIQINIKNNDKFILKGYDIYTNLLLTPWEASLGTKIDIPTIDETTKIYIPQGVQTGEKIKIPNKGYKDGNGGRGDLFAEVKIMVPKELTDEEKAIFEKLNKISNFNPRLKV